MGIKPDLNEVHEKLYAGVSGFVCSGAPTMLERLEQSVTPHLTALYDADLSEIPQSLAELIRGPVTRLAEALDRGKLQGVADDEVEELTCKLLEALDFAAELKGASKRQ